MNIEKGLEIFSGNPKLDKSSSFYKKRIENWREKERFKEEQEEDGFLGRWEAQEAAYFVGDLLEFPLNLYLLGFIRSKGGNVLPLISKWWAKFLGFLGLLEVGGKRKVRCGCAP